MAVIERNTELYQTILQENIQLFIESLDSSLALTSDQIAYIVNLDIVNFNNFQNSVYIVFENLITEGIREDTLEESKIEVGVRLAEKGLPNQMVLIGSSLINAYIQPNILVDEETTERLREERAAEVVPVILLQNQNIVSEGNIITVEIFHILESLGFVDNGYTANIIPIIGSTLLILIIFGIALVYIYLFNKNLYQNKNHVKLLFTIYMFLIISTRLIASLSYIFVPILIFTMIVGMLLEFKLAFVLNTLVTIITFLIFKGGLEYLIYFLITGTITAILTKYALKRNKVIILSLAISCLSALIAGSTSLFLDRAISADILLIITYAFLNGFLTVIICMGTLPFWESVFNVITPLKLLDLTSPDNELLRRLTTEAPGTYHHSIVVANLSEAAAYDIQADTVVARVGAYFHDIGKLRYPQYFVENQVGENPHDEIDPFSSFEIINDHVKYGLQLADEKKLPTVLRDIIEQHHGTTKIQFFYHKAKQENPDMEISENDFKYVNPTPKSKEAAIVMLADVSEAAVRSMVSQTRSSESIENFVDKLIKDKLDEGQLIDSELTIKDLDTIKKAFMRVFNGMYHKRIPYPKDVKGKDRKES